MQAGIRVSQAVATPIGLLFDRYFCLVTAGTLKGITQSQHPDLALVKVECDPIQILTGEMSLEHTPYAALRLTAPNMPHRLEIPLQPPDHPKLKIASIQEWSGLVIDMGWKAANWFSDYLDTPVRLVRYGGTLGCPLPVKDDPLRRSVRAEYLPGSHNDFECAWSDGYSYMIACESTLKSICTSLDVSLDIFDFRPNIVIKNTKSNEESGWRSVQLGATALSTKELWKGVSMLVSTQCCQRSSIVEQSTGVLYRLRSEGEHEKHLSSFGIYGVSNQMGLLRVGDDAEACRLASVEH